MEFQCWVFLKTKELTMENKQRVLAYSMAKVIEPHLLEDISGGANWCHRETAKPSGTDRRNVDVFVDVSIDF
jgi:hypothetical protein